MYVYIVYDDNDAYNTNNLTYGHRQNYGKKKRST